MFLTSLCCEGQVSVSCICLHKSILGVSTAIISMIYLSDSANMSRTVALRRQIKNYLLFLRSKFQEQLLITKKYGYKQNLHYD